MEAATILPLLGLPADAAATLIRVDGGDTAAAFRLEASGKRFFLKAVRSVDADMVEQEAASLEILSGAGAVRVPQVLAHGVTDSSAWLALEWLNLGKTSESSAARLGKALARQHRVLGDRHGWSSDNYIGLSIQPNAQMTSWATFFIENRLKVQLELSRASSHGRSLVDPLNALIARAPELLAGHEPSPSLLHGDLWFGNQAALGDGTPVIFDPASFYGDRETDLAMTRLFGGFPASFYDAYMAEWPLPAGYESRQTLYQLYHVLNHANLFGGTYVGQSLEVISDLLSI